MTINMGGTIYDKITLEKDEALLKESRANLQISFIIPPGGRLFLTNKRLIFRSGKISISTEKLKSIMLNLADITGVEKRQGDMTNLLAGSFRHRLHIQCKDESYIFQLWDLDAWIEQIEEAVKNVL
jgi:hypothetical protein|tara:strand:+ start:1286 stop:1663 length:378 start_codon:yes stop_codon:yes gene_type:complete